MLHCARMRGGSGGTIAPGTQRKIEMASRLVPSQKAGEQAKPQQVARLAIFHKYSVMI